MQGSSGAVNAATFGRGIRFLVQDDDEYQVSLPTLPTGRIVFNTVFLHGDMRARPYRVEDFRDALARLELLPEVLSLGAFQMSHVWAVTFKNEQAVKKMLEAKDVRVKGRQCIVIDPANQDLRLKLHWLLHNVTEEDVRVALAPYGRITDVTRERWRVQGIHDKGSTTRSVTLKLKAGVRAEDIPHQLRVAGELALVVVPGRAPQCLRCQSTGHMRRDCKVPRCSVCRRFGHEAAQCTRTYAAVTGPVPGDSSTELVMDAEETEELAAGSEPPRQPTQEAGAVVPGSSAPPPRVEEIVRVEETTSQVAATDSAASVSPDATLSQQTPTPATEDARDAASNSDANEVRSEDGSATKRPRHERKDQADKEDTANDGKPAPKGLVTRRSSLKPKPNSTPYERTPATAKPP